MNPTSNRSPRPRLVLGALLVLVLGLTTTAHAAAPAPTTAPSPAVSARKGAGPASTAQPEAEDDIRDIRAPLKVPVPFPWAPLALAAAAVVGVGVWLWRRRAHRAARALTPLEAALARIDAARGDPGLEAEAFAAEVSDAVRDYLVTAYRLPADRRTTEEFLYELVGGDARTSPLADQRSQLAALLGHCDRAKYAAWELDGSARNTVCALAERFLSGADEARLAAEEAARSAARHGRGPRDAHATPPVHAATPVVIGAANTRFSPGDHANLGTARP